MKLSIILLIFLIVVSVVAPVSQGAEPAETSDPFEALEGGLDEVDQDMEELKKLLESTGGGEKEPEKKGAASWRRNYRFEYVTFQSSDTGSLPKNYEDRVGGGKTKIGSKIFHSFSPLAETEREIFWVAKIHYELIGVRSSDSVDIHMLRIKQNENPEEAIRKLMDRWRNDVSKDGNMREAFIFDGSKKISRGLGYFAKFDKFTIENLGGPFDNPDEACGPIAGHYSLKGYHQIAELYWSVDPKQQLRIVWDNPKPDKKMYRIFWK